MQQKKNHHSARHRVLGVIPARYDSTRFPGKMLAPLAGKTLLQHTYENAKDCSALDAIIVATDDSRIDDHVASFGGVSVMTSKDCLTGTDRIAEVIEHHREYASYDIIVNIQGDEPTISTKTLEATISVLDHDAEAVMATVAAPITDDAESFDVNVVKCVIDCHGNALYFSRAPIPWRGDLRESLSYRHIGLYAFRRQFLLQLAVLPATPLQISESLEQLKILEHGYRIKVAIVDDRSIGVDTPEDLNKVEQLLCTRNSYSSLAGSSLH